MGWGARRVLVLGADRATARDLDRILGPSFTMEHVASGEEAMRLLAESPFAMVIAEGPGGLELLIAASDVAPLAARVMLASEPDADGILRAVNDAGARAVLRKPLGPPELARLQALASERAFPALEAGLGPDGNEPPCRDVTAQVRSLERALEQKQSTIERLTKQLAATAVRDRVTGLYNERYFFERAEQEVKRARRHALPLSLVLCDLGAAETPCAGAPRSRPDDPLTEVARALAGHGPDPSASLRDTDVVARYAGDLLGVLLPGTHRQGALVVAGRIARVAAARLGELSRPSFGVASLPEDAMCTGELVERADEALYRAKGSELRDLEGHEHVADAVRSPGTRRR